jgi:hypothetical protein
MARKKEGGMRQSALRLPPDLHQRLRRAGGEDGMGAEIRRRLEASFEAERAPKNPKTRELLEAMTFLADKADTHCGNWSEDAFSFEVLKAALQLFLAARRPEGEAVLKPNPNREPFDSFFDPSSTPENIARFILANLAWVKREEKRR